MTAYRYVIVACARWETPYISEWIAYHKAIGFDHIYLYCNDDDETQLRRQVFAEPHVNAFVTFRHFVGQGQQSSMYCDAMNTVRAEAEWVTFLDIDEFLVLRNVNDIHAFMAPFAQSADSVYFNWLMFGNNKFLERPPGNVLPQYTRRAASIDPHTKHLSRVSKLLPEKLALPFFPFWHGLANPLWSGLRRVNVLGDDWGDYFDDFPGRATNIVADAELARKIAAVGAVNHYAFKSEADFALRTQRGLGGNFSGQIKWAELLRAGQHQQYLRELDTTEDTYLRDFAKNHDLRSALTAQPASRRIAARNTSWQAELELDARTGRILHTTNGSTGNYHERQGLLIVDWDHWPLEVFAEVDGIHQTVFAARPSANPAVSANISLNRALTAQIGASAIPVASVCVRIPGGDTLHLRPGTSDIPVFLAIFSAGEYANLNGFHGVKTIIDLGANTGLSAVYFSRIYPDAKIIAVEPESGNFRMMQLNLHGLRNVEPLHAAIWSHDTRLEIDAVENGVRRQDWAFRSREVGHGGDKVQALSMATLLTRYEIDTIDILKVDIEGAEVELFSPGSESWLSKGRCLVVETHDRFRPGSDAAVTRTLAASHQEMQAHGEARVFVRRDLLQTALPPGMVLKASPP